MNSKYQNCNLLICTVGAGVFNKGEIYPFYHINGYAYVCLLDVFSKKPVLFSLDSYEDGTYKWEDAEFKEEVE